MNNTTTHPGKFDDDILPYSQQEDFLGENQLVDDDFHPPREERFDQEILSNRKVDDWYRDEEKQYLAPTHRDHGRNASASAPSTVAVPNKNRRRRAPFRSVRRNHRLNFQKTPSPIGR